MKRAVLGTLIGLGIVAAAVAVAQQQRGEVFGQRPMPVPPATATAAGSELIVVPTSLGERGQMLTVVDPRQRVLCVYQIDLAGKIALKSVRNIHWDLQMTDFNGATPSPQDIQSQLEQLRQK